MTRNYATWLDSGNLMQWITRAQVSVDTQTSRLDDGTEAVTERKHKRGNRYAKRGCRTELPGSASFCSVTDEVNDLRQLSHDLTIS
jgi:hypothetical protein